MAYQTVVVKEPPLLRALPYISIIAFFLIWETAVRSGMIPQTLLAAPSQVFDAFIDKLTNPNPDGAVMATHFKTSLQEAAIGYVLALLVGLPLGLAMGLSSKVRAVFDYLIEFYRPLPPLAYYTLLVLWFGIGEFSKILLLFLAAIPPLTIGAVEGVKEVSPSVIQAARSLGADSRQVFCRIILPATTPAIITSMRISLGFTYTVLVAAEIVAATEGIGWMVWDASKFMRSDIIFVGIITMGVTGIGLDACLRFAAKHLLRWKRQ